MTPQPTVATCHALAELDSNGVPIRYLPFLGATGWLATRHEFLADRQPGSRLEIRRQAVRARDRRPGQFGAL